MPDYLHPTNCLHEHRQVAMSPYRRLHPVVEIRVRILAQEPVVRGRRLLGPILQKNLAAPKNLALLSAAEGQSPKNYLSCSCWIFHFA